LAAPVEELVAAGLQVTLAPTGIPGSSFEPGHLLPSVSALQQNYYAIYELLANAVRYVGIRMRA
jgi:hypothetical protein